MFTKFIYCNTFTYEIFFLNALLQYFCLKGTFSMERNKIRHTVGIIPKTLKQCDYGCFHLRQYSELL